MCSGVPSHIAHDSTFPVWDAYASFNHSRVVRMNVPLWSAYKIVPLDRYFVAMLFLMLMPFRTSAVLRMAVCPHYQRDHPALSGRR